MVSNRAFIFHVYYVFCTKVKIICQGQGQISRSQFLKKKKKKKKCRSVKISVSQILLVSLLITGHTYQLYRFFWGKVVIVFRLNTCLSAILITLRDIETNPDPEQNTCTVVETRTSKQTTLTFHETGFSPARLYQTQTQ